MTPPKNKKQKKGKRSSSPLSIPFNYSNAPAGFRSGGPVTSPSHGPTTTTPAYSEDSFPPLTVSPSSSTSAAAAAPVWGRPRASPTASASTSSHRASTSTYVPAISNTEQSTSQRLTSSPSKEQEKTPKKKVDEALPYPRLASLAVSPPTTPRTSPGATTPKWLKPSASPTASASTSSPRASTSTNVPAISSPEQSTSQRLTPSSSKKQEGTPKKTQVARKLTASVGARSKILLQTNFWDVHVKEKSTVYRYDVSITANYANSSTCVFSNAPNGGTIPHERCTINQAIVRHVLDKYASSLDDKEEGEIASVYDSAAQLYTNKQINFSYSHNPELSIKQTVTKVDFNRAYPNLVRWEDLHWFDVEICPNEAMPSVNIRDFSKEGNQDLNLVNTVVSNFLNLLTTTCGRNAGWKVFGDKRLFRAEQIATGTKTFGQQKEQGVSKGIKFVGDFQSGQPSTILPNFLLDTKQTAFFVPQSIYKALQDCGDMPIASSQKWANANHYVKGLRFTTCYKARDYIAYGISEEKIGELVFPGDGAPVYVVNYLRGLLKGSKIVINENNPAVVVKTSKADQPFNYFAMETANILPNQRVPVSKQPAQTANPPLPPVRFDEINRAMNDLQLCQRRTVMDSFGVSLSAEPKKVEAFRRAPPTLKFQNSIFVNPDTCTWNRKGIEKFVLPVKIENCYVVSLKEDENTAKEVREKLRQECRACGVVVTNWHVEHFVMPHRNPTPKEISGQIEKYLSRLPKPTSINSNFVFFIDKLESKTHGWLKLAERKQLVLTQQITSKVARDMVKPNKPLIASNVVKKLNMKLGGLNYFVSPERASKKLWIDKNDLLIISYDVAHPGKLDASRQATEPSVVGFSFNGGKCSQSFVGDYHYQNPNQERVDDSILVERVKWMLDIMSENRPGCYPDNILIIRDGVSEGQYSMVINEELVSIRNAVDAWKMKSNRKSNWKPKFGLIIATKRHNGRLFVSRETENNRSSATAIENPLPLTVVDRSITRPFINEAYIVSAKASKGTAKPVCYQLLVNEIEFPNMDEVEALMIALTFTHQITFAPIALPEPVFQADEWAKRGTLMWKAHCEKYGRPEVMDFEQMTKNLSWRDVRSFRGLRLNA